jgi:peptidoglycan/xylan/chitin deacetylase (PgdA/CDA1 family)
VKKRIALSVVLCIKVVILFIGCSTAENIDTINNEIDKPNFVENSSLEIADAGDSNMPENWAYNCWGKNITAFTYLNEGYSGDHSVKIEVADYEDGDAKWFFDPVKLTPGDYIFSNYYRSNVDTKVIVTINTHAGDKEYIDLPIAPASEEWIKFEASFIVPEYAETVTVYHLLAKDGYLITDEHQINSYSFEGFNRGLVTITFDDGWEENTKTALPILQEFGYKTNQFYATTYIENPRVTNPKNLIKLFVYDGHEIGSHSISHPYLTTLSEQEVTGELKGSQEFLENYLGINIKHFATPFGAYNTFIKEDIMNYYNAHRTAIDFGFNSKDNFDVSRLKSQSVLLDTTTSEFEEWVRKAKDEKLWLILLYHKVTDNPNEYDTTPQIFLEQMHMIMDADLPVVTISEALTELVDQ